MRLVDDRVPIWLRAIAIALLTGAVSMVAGGLVADRCVSWYRVSSFEGGSGYFVAFAILASGIAGTILGLVVAIVGLRRDGGAGRALGGALIAVLVIAGGSAGLARVLADVPPEIDGETLYLLLEVRWPPGQRPPAAEAGAGLVTLGSLSGPFVRAEEAGALFLEDARLEGDSYVVPAAVEIFTSRGSPVVSLSAGTTTIATFEPPLRHYPRREDLQWSDWRDSDPDPAHRDAARVSYRFRVSPRSAAMRWEAIGPLVVETRTPGVYVSDGLARATSPRFDVRQHGVLVSGFGDVGDLAVVSQAPLALLGTTETGCRLLTLREGAAVAVTELPPCRADGPAWKLDDDPPARATTSESGRSWFDRTSFTAPGFYLLGPACIDTRTLAFIARGWPSEPMHMYDLPPLGLSPDRRTLVWFSPGNGYDEPPVIASVRLDTGAVSTLPIDRRRMRYRTPELDVDSRWLAHHFAWARADDGAERLEARTDIVVQPYRGALSAASAGEYQAYDLAPGGRALRTAIVDILVKELHATPLPEAGDTIDTPRVSLDGLPLSVQHVDGDRIVRVQAFQTRPEVMARLAAALDAILASGRLDDLMTEEPRP